jgi:hypothetical protein
MQRYGAADGQSGIAAFEIKSDSITIEFRHGGIYRYDRVKPGRLHVSEMQRLARMGKGLNTYINKYVKDNFAEKLS